MTPRPLHLSFVGLVALLSGACGKSESASKPAPASEKAKQLTEEVVTAPPGTEICPHFSFDRTCQLHVRQGKAWLLEHEKIGNTDRSWGLKLWRADGGRWVLARDFGEVWSHSWDGRFVVVRLTDERAAVFDVERVDRPLAEWTVPEELRGDESDGQPRVWFRLDRQARWIQTLYMAAGADRSRGVHRLQVASIAKPTEPLYRWQAPEGQRAVNTIHAFGTGAAGFQFGLVDGPDWFVDTRTWRATRLPFDPYFWTDDGTRPYFLVKGESGLELFTLEAGEPRELWSRSVPEFTGETWISRDGQTLTWRGPGRDTPCVVERWATGKRIEFECRILKVAPRGSGILVGLRRLERRGSGRPRPWRLLHGWDELEVEAEWVLDTNRMPSRVGWSEDGRYLRHQSKRHGYIFEAATGRKVFDRAFDKKYDKLRLRRFEPGWQILSRGGTARWGPLPD